MQCVFWFILVPLLEIYQCFFLFPANKILEGVYWSPSVGLLGACPHTNLVELITYIFLMRLDKTRT